jgi:predicted glycosyltransferase
MNRVLFHARNRRGLGHLVRVNNIVCALSDIRPQFDIRVHATCPPPNGFWEGETVITTDIDHSWASVVEQFDPQVIVHDTTLKHVDTRGKAKHILIMRRRTPEQHVQLLSNPLLSVVDRIIVPHHVDDFDAELPAEVAEKTTFAGPIARGARRSVEAVREHWGLEPDQTLVTVTVGGGGFAEQADRFFVVAAAMLRALAAAYPRMAFVVVLGPNYHDTSIAAALSDVPNTRVIAVVPHLIDLIAASDLVIAEGGYNTVTEVQLAQVPAVFIPSTRRLDDQRERVERVALGGGAIVIDPSDEALLSARRLVALVASPTGLSEMRSAAASRQLQLGNALSARIIAEVMEQGCVSQKAKVFG